ncbi:MAG: hypothetical protein KGL39_24765 [Patescibacteria group bacterium]|nr:hypothetical protein [Patescibacteria group bacterium]
MKKLYFAHPVADYNTPRERDFLEFLKTAFKGYEIVNPNTPEHENAYREKGMEHFYEIIKDCQVLVAWAFEDGKLGAGVAGEIECAFNNGIPVYVEIPSLEPVSRLPEDLVLTVEETRARLRPPG